MTIFSQPKYSVLYSFLRIELLYILFLDGFNNVISFSLKLNFENITGLYQNDTLVIDDDIIQDAFLSFNVKIYCCFENAKCGSVLANGSKTESSDWRLVIDTNGDIDFITYQVCVFVYSSDDCTIV